MKVLGMIHNDKKSMWVVGESEESIAIGFIVSQIRVII